jgi:hypothetical protein
MHAVTNQSVIQGEIERRLNSDNAWYHSVQNLLSSACGSVWVWNLGSYISSNIDYGFENMVLRRIFVPKGDGVMRAWRELHNEELHYLHSSPSIIRLINPRRIRWTGYIA